MGRQASALGRDLVQNLRDLLPIVAVILVFQLLVVGEPMDDPGRRAAGALAALLGLTFFVRGLAMSIFPVGAELADRLARRGSVLVLVGFGFAIGFASTIAEPALAAVAGQAAAAVAADPGEAARIALLLRVVVSVALGAALALGVVRIVLGWPVAWFVLPGYGLATAMALASDSPLALIAFGTLIGFTATLIEPTLTAAAGRVEDATGGALRTFALRIVVSAGIALGLLLGSLRIVYGIPLAHLLLAICVILVPLALTAPRAIVPLALDSGGIATSVVTVPLIAAFGVALAEAIPRETGPADGFGLIVLALLGPPVLILGMAHLKRARARRSGMGDSGDAL